MALETAQGTAAPEGQAATGAPETASAAAPAPGTSGQPQGTEGTTGQTGPRTEDLLFDPQEYERLTKELPDNLRHQAEALKKSLQGAFTKKTQAIADAKKKIEAYDAFSRDPKTALEQMAQQMGFRLSPAQAAAAAQAATGEGWEPTKGDPQSWNDVAGYLLNKMREEFGGKLQPIVNEFKTLKKQTIESQLTEIDPSWQTYEDAMAETLSKHPSLATDPAGLYRLSVPPEVLESRAVQKALARLEGKKSSAQVAGASSTTKKAPELPSGPLTFAQAVEAAKRQLSEQGLSG
jgi:hypothetical protein